MFIFSSSSEVTTHTFRRGGAQYRFFCAKVKLTVTDCLSWGGWTEGESHQTLVRYLLNEYEIKDGSREDLCSPYRADRNYGPTQDLDNISMNSKMDQVLLMVRKLNSDNETFNRRIKEIKDSLDTGIPRIVAGPPGPIINDEEEVNVLPHPMFKEVEDIYDVFVNGSKFPYAVLPPMTDDDYATKWTEHQRKLPNQHSKNRFKQCKIKVFKIGTAIHNCRGTNAKEKIIVFKEKVLKRVLEETGKKKKKPSQKDILKFLDGKSWEPYAAPDSEPASSAYASSSD